MDIIAVSTGRKEEASPTMENNDYSSLQSTDNTQDSNDYWEQANYNSFRLRTVSCPSRPDTTSDTFGQLHSLFSAKKEDPNLSVQITDYNRKHDSWMMLTFNEEVSLTVYRVV